MTTPGEQQLIGIIKQNEEVLKVLELAARLDLPNWYVGAGCITQSVWNKLHNYPIAQNILDIDLVFYDPKRMSSEHEEEIRKEINSSAEDLSLEIDVVNEASVHLWYEDHTGIKIDPYTSCEDAISTWPSTATSIGINFVDHSFNVYAPFGLDDLFNLIVRPNKKIIPREVFEKKATRWKSNWPKLKVIDWDSK